jgi:hypothetical protein
VPATAFDRRGRPRFPLTRPVARRAWSTIAARAGRGVPRHSVISERVLFSPDRLDSDVGELIERAMIRERVMAGLSRAKADGTQLGRRRLGDTDAGKVAAILAARANRAGIRRIARELGVGVGTVLRVTGEASDPVLR